MNPLALSTSSGNSAITPGGGALSKATGQSQAQTQVKALKTAVTAQLTQDSQLVQMQGQGQKIDTYA